MKTSYLALLCGVLLFVVLSMAWCKPRPQPQTTGVPSSSAAPSAPTRPATLPKASPTSTPAPKGSATESQSPELRKARGKTAPAVIQVSVFDASGKLLRTGTGFFVSDDGKFVTNRSLVEGGVNAIATTSDKKIHNVAGVLAESPEFDLAVLKAEAKQVPFLPLNNVATPERGARVTIVRSPMTGREGTNSDTEIAARRSDEKGEWLDLSTPPANETSGSPVVNENGVVIGIISSDRAKTPPAYGVLSSNSLQSFLVKVDPNIAARWAAAPSPTKSPKPYKGKIIFSPSPNYPSDAYDAIIKGSGNYRITFDTTGRVKNVQVLRSTGAASLDRAAVTAFQQWKSEPGQEWSINIPVSFQPKARN